MEQFARSLAPIRDNRNLQETTKIDKAAAPSDSMILGAVYVLN